MGGKARHEMSLAELEAAAEWLGRNRLREHLHLLEGDHRFGWAVRSLHGWTPPVGRAAGAKPATRRRTQPSEARWRPESST